MLLVESPRHPEQKVHGPTFAALAHIETHIQFRPRIGRGKILS